MRKAAISLLRYLDRKDNVIERFSRKNCFPIRVDRTQVQVSWNDHPDLAGLAGEPVKFRFHLRNARLYAFWVSADKSGASGGYHAAGLAPASGRDGRK